MSEVTDTDRINWLESMSIMPIELDNMVAPDPFFITIESGDPAKPLRFQGVGIRETIDKAMAAAPPPPAMHKIAIAPDRAARLVRDVQAHILAAADRTKPHPH